MTEATYSSNTTTTTPALYLACELGSTTWVLAFTTAPAQRARLRRIAAGDVEARAREIAAAKERFGRAADAAVHSCYEAGRDGFWLHRWLEARAVANVVVDSSSIEVNRRARRAKTDRLDAGRLLMLLLRWCGGETRVWSVVHVPTPEAEAQRQLTREMAVVLTDRTRARNRLKGLLASQGTRLPMTRRFLAALADARTGDGRPLAEAYRARLQREWEHLRSIEARLQTLSTARAAQIVEGHDRVAVIARRLCTVRGVAEVSAAVFSAEHRVRARRRDLVRLRSVDRSCSGAKSPTLVGVGIEGDVAGHATGRRVGCPTIVPYEYGRFVCMKKTLHIDERLLRDAKAAAGAKTDTDTVRLGLEALVRRAAYERLRALRGSEPHAAETPRRRERPIPAKHSAA